MTKRTPAARRRPVKRTTRKPGVLAALRALLRSLFNRPAPASGGGGAPPRSAPPRRRWDDNRDRDEFGRWEPDESEFDEISTTSQE